ncbi:MAG: hypothetical protein LBV16_04670 [Elusimicrobiota bacterium]|jgi:hypothetical protein|nr:hypothetical protein [Elusimicrobiota bacterium]
MKKVLFTLFVCFLSSIIVYAASETQVEIKGKIPNDKIEIVKVYRSGYLVEMKVKNLTNEKISRACFDLIWLDDNLEQIGSGSLIISNLYPGMTKTEQTYGNRTGSHEDVEDWPSCLIILDRLDFALRY